MPEPAAVGRIRERPSAWGVPPDLMAAQFDGHEWAALKPMCDTLGIDYSAQLKRLKGRSWATVEKFSTVAADGKTYQTTVIDSGTIPMWLATIDERRG